MKGRDMKVGDLVKVKYNGSLGLVTRIVMARSYYKSLAAPSPWVFLSGHDSPYKPHSLEVVNAGA